MFSFQDDLVNEYSEFKKANPDSFNWWSYVNMKSDLQTALSGHIGSASGISDSTDTIAFFIISIDGVA